MQEKDPDKLAALVVATHAATRATFDIARQLNELVPIDSKEEFVKQARLSIGDEEVAVEGIEHYLPETLFPVRDTEDLVKKVATVIRVSGQVLAGAYATKRPAGIARLVDELEAERAAATKGVAHFFRPPLFGGELAEGS